MDVMMQMDVFTYKKNWKALYGQEDETVDHLLACCVYARELRCRILRPIGWERLMLAPGMALSVWCVRKMDPKPIYFGFWCLMTNTTKLD